MIAIFVQRWLGTEVRKQMYYVLQKYQAEGIERTILGVLL